MPPHKYLEEIGLAAMLAKKNVSRCCTRDDSQRMCNTYTSAKWELGCPLWLWIPRVSPKFKKGVSVTLHMSAKI